jgi:hypothetical protein
MRTVKYDSHDNASQSPTTGRVLKDIPEAPGTFHGQFRCKSTPLSINFPQHTCTRLSHLLYSASAGRSYSFNTIHSGRFCNNSLAHSASQNIIDHLGKSDKQ